MAFNFGDVTKYLTPENIALISEGMKFYEEAKPFAMRGLKYWLNNRPDSLRAIVESLTDERAKELARLLAKKKEGS